jgi:hypothetical protein
MRQRRYRDIGGGELALEHVKRSRRLTLFSEPCCYEPHVIPPLG